MGYKELEQTKRDRSEKARSCCQNSIKNREIPHQLAEPLKFSRAPYFHASNGFTSWCENKVLYNNYLWP